MTPLPKTIPRAALVTGGGRRIGRALVQMLAQEGFSVAIHCHRSVSEAEALLGYIGGRGCVLQADLTCEDATSGLMDAARARLGPIGVLINNASVFTRDDIETVTRESWDRHLEPNLRAPFVLAQALARQLPDTAGGVVINLLDQRVWNLTPHFMTYTLSKAGLWTLTQTLALALAPRIRVNAIGPGPVLPAKGQSEEHFSAMCARTPLACGASVAEIAEIARCLIALPSVTGQMMALDGGQHLNWSPR